MSSSPPPRPRTASTAATPAIASAPAYSASGRSDGRSRRVRRRLEEPVAAARAAARPGRRRRIAARAGGVGHSRIRARGYSARPASDRRSSSAGRGRGGSPVARVCQLAAAQGETAAADALGQALLEALQLGDPLVDAGAPRGRELRPVAARRHAVGGQLVELLADLVEAEPHPLREHDERHPPDHRPVEAAVAGPRALGADQAALLVEAQRRGRDSAAGGHLADREQLGHASIGSTDGDLTSSALELASCAA